MYMMDMKKSFVLAWSYLLCQSLCNAYELTHDERLIQRVDNKIDAEKFIYYRLQQEGQLKLILISIDGDVDIFASAEEEYPSFYNYGMKSETCGLDVITVPSDMQRPVYIGLYGHQRHPTSKFRLLIVSIPKPKVTTYEDLVAQYERNYFEETGYAEMRNKAGSKKSTSESDRSDSHAEDDTPIWWKILLGIIEFGIEVVL